MKKKLFLLLFLSLFLFIFFKMYQSNKQNRIMLKVKKDVNSILANPLHPNHKNIVRFMSDYQDNKGIESIPYKQISVKHVQLLNQEKAIVTLEAILNKKEMNKKDTASISLSENNNKKTVNKTDSLCIINANALCESITIGYSKINSDSMLTYCFTNQLWSLKNEKWVFIENCDFCGFNYMEKVRYNSDIVKQKQ